MHSAVKSIMLRSSGVKAMTSHILPPKAIGGDDSDAFASNPYAGKSFYDDENFRAVLERLNDGKLDSTLLFSQLVICFVF